MGYLCLYLHQYVELFMGKRDSKWKRVKDRRLRVVLHLIKHLSPDVMWVTQSVPRTVGSHITFLGLRIQAPEVPALILDLRKTTFLLEAQKYACTQFTKHLPKECCKGRGRGRGEAPGEMNGPLESRKCCWCQEPARATSEHPWGNFWWSALGKYLSTSPPQHFDQYTAHWQIFP